MSSLESRRFCDLSEYTNGKDERLPEIDLLQGETYAMMFALGTAVSGKRAVRHLVRVDSPAHYESERQMWVVQFSLLDDDMRATEPTFGALQNGYLQYPECVTFNGAPVTEAYFHGRSEDAFDEGLRAIVGDGAAPVCEPLVLA